MGRCEPDVNTSSLHSETQKPKIMYHRLVDSVFLEKNNVSFKHTQFYTGSASAFISLSPSYSLFQESQSKFHSVGLEGKQSLWRKISLIEF